MYAYFCRFDIRTANLNDKYFDKMNPDRIPDVVSSQNFQKYFLKVSADQLKC